MKLSVPGIVGEEFSGEEVRECLYPELEGEHLAADYYNRQSLHTEIYKIKIRFLEKRYFQFMDIGIVKDFMCDITFHFKNNKSKLLKTRV